MLKEIEMKKIINVAFVLLFSPLLLAAMDNAAGFTEDEYTLFEAANKCQETICGSDIVKKNMVSIGSSCDFAGDEWQTEKGMFLKITRADVALCAPWGSWKILKQKCLQLPPMNDKFITQLITYAKAKGVDLEEREPQDQNILRVLCPESVDSNLKELISITGIKKIYEVKRVDAYNLPKACLKPRNTYLLTEAVEGKMLLMTERYEKEHPQLDGDSASGISSTRQSEQIYEVPKNFVIEY